MTPLHVLPLLLPVVQMSNCSLITSPLLLAKINVFPVAGNEAVNRTPASEESLAVLVKELTGLFCSPFINRCWRCLNKRPSMCPSLAAGDAKVSHSRIKMCENKKPHMHTHP